MHCSTSICLQFVCYSNMYVSIFSHTPPVNSMMLHALLCLPHIGFIWEGAKVNFVTYFAIFNLFFFKSISETDADCDWLADNLPSIQCYAKNPTRKVRRAWGPCFLTLNIQYVLCDHSPNIISILWPTYIAVKIIIAWESYWENCANTFEGCPILCFVYPTYNTIWDSL